MENRLIFDAAQSPKFMHNSYFIKDSSNHTSLSDVVAVAATHSIATEKLSDVVKYGFFLFGNN